MPFITNQVFTDQEKTFLELVLQHDFPEKPMVVDQLNNMKQADLLRDVTPYYWIMEFRPDGVNPGHGPMRRTISFLVRHKDCVVPTEFNLYERNGQVFELEIFNADSSKIDLTTIMDGEVFILHNA